MNNRDLYLASTPLTALVSAAAACASGRVSRLFLISDFPSVEHWAQVLRDWRGTPFETVVVLPGRATEQAFIAPGGRWQRERIKTKLRRQCFAAIRTLDQTWLPDRVLVGNDRRPETQLALHLASRRCGAPCGVYLDDGLFTYLGDVHRRPFARGIIDNLLKKWRYGSFSQYRAQVGTTRWIAEAWLAYPELAQDHSSQRRRLALPRSWFLSPRFLRLCCMAQRAFGIDRARLRQCQILLVLPHSRLWKNQLQLREQMQETIARLNRDGWRLALKHHPREAHADPLALAAYVHYQVPNAMASELLLLTLPNNAALIGEASTALLTARWLRPDLAVYDLRLSATDFVGRAANFLAEQGVSACNIEFDFQ